mmetsp:Transcript_21583/g.35860  ORF Transcript_21583/g.35860 Transcript_21583/m.35860 type:complete len:502 (-) Transcript_21583:691-2196(-)
MPWPADCISRPPPRGGGGGGGGFTQASQTVRRRTPRRLVDVDAVVLGDGVHVLVPAAAQVHQDVGALRQLLGELHGVVHRVGGLEGGDQPLGLAQHRERLHGLLVRDGHVLRAPAVLEEGVLGPDARVVQAGGDGVRLRDLPVLVLQQVRAGPVQHPGLPLGQGGGGLAARALAPGLDAHDLHVLVLQEGVEHADGVAAAAHAGDDVVRQLAGLLDDLAAGLAADDRLEVADDGRERVRPDGGADEVVRVADVGHPVAHGLVDGVLQRAAARLHGHHLGPQHLHAEHVELLTLAVDGTHIHRAVQVHEGADAGSGHPVLPSPSLCNDAALAKALCEQRLAHGVVDLVGSGVRELLTLEPDVGTAKLIGDTLGQINGRGPADELFAVEVDLLLERGVLQSRGVGLLQLPMRLHECLRNVAPTELSKVRVLAAGGIPHIHDLGVVGDVRSPGLNGRGHHEGEGFELGLPVHGGHAIHHSSLDGVDDGRTHHHSVREGGHLLHL